MKILGSGMVRSTIQLKYIPTLLLYKPWRIFSHENSRERDGSLNYSAEAYSHSTLILNLGEFSVMKILGSGMVRLTTQLKYIPARLI